MTFNRSISSTETVVLENKPPHPESSSCTTVESKCQVQGEKHIPNQGQSLVTKGFPAHTSTLQETPPPDSLYCPEFPL